MFLVYFKSIYRVFSNSSLCILKCYWLFSRHSYCIWVNFQKVQNVFKNIFIVYCKNDHHVFQKVFTYYIKKCYHDFKILSDLKILSWLEKCSHVIGINFHHIFGRLIVYFKILTWLKKCHNIHIIVFCKNGRSAFKKCILCTKKSVMYDWIMFKMWNFF